MSVIFLSYRRDASAGYAGWLHDRLTRRYGARNVFMDVYGVQIGDDFVERIKKEVAASDVMLALIDRDWAGGPGGRNRLDDPKDFVRLELTAAWECGVVIVPVILPGASFPDSGKLPEALAKLAFINAFFLPANGFHEAVDRLIQDLDGTLRNVARSRREQAKAERKRLREQARLQFGNSKLRMIAARTVRGLASLLAGSTRRLVLTLMVGVALGALIYAAKSFVHDVPRMHAKLGAPVADPVTYAELPPVIVHALEATEGASFLHFSAAYVLPALEPDEDCGRESILSLDLARVLLGSPTSSWPQKVRAGAAAAYLTSSLKREDMIARYAQRAFFGQIYNRPIAGFRQAARSFYATDLQQLSLPEAAGLVALVADPLQRNFYRHPERGLEARNCVLKRMVEQGYINAEQGEMAARQPLELARPVVSARRAFSEASTAIHGWRADAVLVGLSQRGVSSEASGDVKRDDFVSCDGNSDIWVAEFSSPGARMLKTILIVHGTDLPPDVETRYADLPERFTDFTAIGEDWIDSTSAVRLAIEEARRNKAPTGDFVYTAALTRVGTAPPEWTIHFRQRATDDIVYVVRIDAISQKILLASAL